MYYVLFNFRGILGNALGTAATMAIFWIANRLGFSTTTNIELAYGACLAVSLAAVFALFTDRCELKGVFRSYRDSIGQAIYLGWGQDVPSWITVNGRRRLALLVWPLAMGPLIVFLTATALWIGDKDKVTPEETHAAYLKFWLASLASVVATIGIAYATQGIRRQR